MAFSWGDVSECLLTPDRGPRKVQSKDTIKAQCGDSWVSLVLFMSIYVRNYFQEQKSLITKVHSRTGDSSPKLETWSSLPNLKAAGQTGNGPFQVAPLFQEAQLASSFSRQEIIILIDTSHRFRTPYVCLPPQWKFASEEVAMEHDFSSSFLSEFFLFAESWLDYIGLQGDYTKSLAHPMAHPLVTMDYGIQTGLMVMSPGLWFSWLYVSPLFSYSLY